MNGIQVLLLVGTIIISLAFITKTHRKGFNVILLVMSAAISVTFILWPDITTKIARLFGVGRGTDFLLYISILFFSYLVIQLFARIRKLEQMITDIVRNNAIHSASSLNPNQPEDATKAT